MKADGFAAAYGHRISGAQDPQLHTHVVVVNVTRGADGRWTALHEIRAQRALDPAPAFGTHGHSLLTA